MTTIDLGPLGAVLSPAGEGFVETAVELEGLGFSTIWVTGGPMSSLDQLADVVRATRTARVASGIIPVDSFGADDVIALYQDLERDHPGRLVVGLGGAHGAGPMATLGAYLDRLDRAVPPAARVMAALGPKMLRLARDRAAGALPVLVTPGYTAGARQVLGDGPTLAIEQLVVLETDPGRARQFARGPLGFLGQVPAYQANFRRMGFSDDDIASLGDHLVDELVTWGGADRIAAQVAAHREAGADHMALSIVAEAPVPPLEQWHQLARALTA
ncbi:MAG: TIGR03620 family F420-dependent LLM class oxidoreductase [Acidimicrobiia bacterium]|nr:TIGR03620 family F420-dependent LLM class oxidoreductase [Acidimicrobiia bacterium]